MPSAASSVLSEINKLTSLNLRISTWDFLIFLFLAAVTFVYALLFVSRGRLVPILISTYASLVLINSAPFLTLDLGSVFGHPKLYEIKLLAFGLAFLIIVFVLSRVILQSPVGSETFGTPASFLISITQVGFLVAVLVSFLPKEITNEFSHLTRQIFLGERQFFYWALAPVVFLLIFGRKANKELG